MLELLAALVLALPWHCVDDQYEVDLTYFDGNSYRQILGRPDALLALQDLFAQMEDEGLHPVLISGYRSYSAQAALYAKDPVYHEPPGCSQHQLGTAFDIGWQGYVFKSPYNDQLYEALARLGPEYGFEIPYDGSGDLPAEPWHLNYILPEVKIPGVMLKSFDPAQVIRNTVRWTPLVLRVDEPYLNVPLILSVIAQESRGINGQTSADGWYSVGLMQVIPRPHLGTAQQLMEPHINIWVGTRMLSETIEKAIALGYDEPVLIGLAAYNCGWKEWPLSDTISFKFCGRHGGINYAIRVLEYWCPYFSEDASTDCTTGVEYSRGFLDRYPIGAYRMAEGICRKSLPVCIE